MKIAIIDDDQNDREYLTTYIKNYGQNHPFPFSIDTFSSGELFFKNSIYTEYSIIFVDIYIWKELMVLKLHIQSTLQIKTVL